MVAESNVSEKVRELVTSLERETALYERLTDAAREIASAVSHGEYEALDSLLESKEAVIAELRVVAETTDRLRNNLGEDEKTVQSARAKAAGALEKAGTALEALLELERRNEELLRSTTDSIRTELAELVRGRRLLDGYRAGRQTTSLFMDKRR